MVTMIAARARDPMNGSIRFQTRYAEKIKIPKKKICWTSLCVVELIPVLYTQFFKSTKARFRNELRSSSGQYFYFTNYSFEATAAASSALRDATTVLSSAMNVFVKMVDRYHSTITTPYRCCSGCKIFVNIDNLLQSDVESLFTNCSKHDTVIATLCSMGQHRARITSRDATSFEQKLSFFTIPY